MKFETIFKFKFQFKMNENYMRQYNFKLDCVRHPIVIDEPNARLRRLNRRSSDPTKDGG